MYKENNDKELKTKRGAETLEPVPEGEIGEMVLNPRKIPSAKSYVSAN